MTKREISERVLSLLDLDSTDIIDAIYDLAREIESNEEEKDDE